MRRRHASAAFPLARVVPAEGGRAGPPGAGRGGRRAASPAGARDGWRGGLCSAQASPLPRASGVRRRRAGVCPGRAPAAGRGGCALRARGGPGCRLPAGGCSGRPPRAPGRGRAARWGPAGRQRRARGVGSACASGAALTAAGAPVRAVSFPLAWGLSHKRLRVYAGRGGCCVLAQGRQRAFVGFF